MILTIFQFLEDQLGCLAVLAICFQDLSKLLFCNMEIQVNPCDIQAVFHCVSAESSQIELGLIIP